jgi:hypothetical protein
VERDLKVLGVRRWRELVIDRENGEVLFDRQKPTSGCSADGRRRRRRRRMRRRRRRLFEMIVGVLTTCHTQCT